MLQGSGFSKFSNEISFKQGKWGDLLWLPSKFYIKGTSIVCMNDHTSTLDAPM
jgi:hypothetical protein